MSQPIADDGAAIAAARSGDRGALERLARMFRPRLEDFAARMTVDPAGAASLVRDIDVRVRLYLDQWRPEERYDAFVARLAAPQLGYHAPIDLATVAARPEFARLPSEVGSTAELGDTPLDVWLAFRSLGGLYPFLHLVHRSGLSEDEAAGVLVDPIDAESLIGAARGARVELDERFGLIGPAELRAVDLFARFTQLATQSPAVATPARAGHRGRSLRAGALAGAAIVAVGIVGGVQAFGGDEAPATAVLGTSVEQTTTTSAEPPLTRPTLPPVAGGNRPNTTAAAPAPTGSLAGAVGVSGTAGATSTSTRSTTTARPPSEPAGVTTTLAAGDPTTTSRPGSTTSRPGSTTTTSTTRPPTTTTSTTRPPTTTTSTTRPPTTTTPPTTTPPTTTPPTTTPPTTTPPTTTPPTTTPPTTTPPTTTPPTTTPPTTTQAG